jgi:predicted thioesterase
VVALAGELPTVTPEELERLADDFLADRALALTPVDLSGRPVQPRWTTPELLEAEQRMVTAAVGRTGEGTGTVGAEVVVEAELTEVEGRRLVFSFVARQKSRESPDSTGGTDRADDEESAVVGAGTVERVIVDRERFVAGARR